MTFDPGRLLELARQCRRCQTQREKMRNVNGSAAAGRAAADAERRLDEFLAAADAAGRPDLFAEDRP